MAVLITILALFMTILLLGMVGDKDATNRRNFTIAFCTVVIAMVALVFKCM